MNEWAVNKRSINQGDKIATSASPLWEAGEAFAPVTSGHNPCGYWFNGPEVAVPTYTVYLSGYISQQYIIQLMLITT